MVPVVLISLDTGTVLFYVKNSEAQKINMLFNVANPAGYGNTTQSKFFV
jgi:hypothetical protein